MTGGRVACRNINPKSKIGKRGNQGDGEGWVSSFENVFAAEGEWPV